ncbi:FAD-dependent monooxygenase [Chlamydiifrater phoenicopteri]|uniref:FAD-dependent monooxygenase n=1 Tax=Chlamydiifrater phoenicopteri TaxID=2681469 RepID=UPI001BCA7F36|nr:FAD-dependent monooxygenase [Chlamydiifrater phoenicopteri]
MTEVLIIGANPTGLILASHLVSRGFSVRVIDHREDSEGPIGSSEVSDIPVILSCSSLELLSGMDLLENFALHGHKLLGAQYNWNQKTIAFKFNLPSQSATPYSLSTTYKTLEKFLIAKFIKLGGVIDWNMRPVTLVDNNIFIEKISTSSNFENREILSPKWILACEADDNRSVRELVKAGGKFRKTTRENCTVLCKESDHLSDDYVHVLPANGSFLNFAFYNPQLESRVLWLSGMSTPPPKLCRKILFTNNLVVQSEGSSTKTTHFSLPEHHHNILFVGNSSNNFSLSYLCGINSNIHAACNLAWKLHLVLCKESPQTLLTSKEVKESCMFPVVGKYMQKKSHRIPFYGSLSSTVVYWFLKSYSKVSSSNKDYYQPHQALRYTNSAIIKNSNKEKNTSELRPGSRAIDVKMPDGSFLLDPIKGSKHLLIFFKDRPELTKAIKEEYGDWIEVSVAKDPKVFSAYNASAETLFVVRPDRYIGYCTHSFKLQELISYLLRIFVKSPV